jgi:hypothetical protein
VKDVPKGVLILFALLVAFFAAVGVLNVLRQSSCDRLDVERIAHLEPGHDTPGVGSMYVKGVGPGPPRSELEEYLDAEAEMHRAGCSVPGALLPTPEG